MDITGTLKVKNAEQKVSEKFKKREFVIVDNSSQYPQYLQFQLTQDRCSLLDSYNIGDELKVYFNLRGREWTNPQGEVKYFNSLEAWKIEGKPSSSTNSNSAAMMDDPIAAGPSSADDLPF